MRYSALLMFQESWSPCKNRSQTLLQCLPRFTAVCLFLSWWSLRRLPGSGKPSSAQHCAPRITASCVEGEDRITIGNIIADVEECCYGPQGESQRNKAAGRLLRAPLVLLVIARITPHAKIPEIEQVMSVAAAVQNMLLAAHASSVGAIWRTGPVTFERLLAEKLGLAPDERLLGFLYLGTPKGELKTAPSLDVDNFFKTWTAP